MAKKSRGKSNTRATRKTSAKSSRGVTSAKPLSKSSSWRELDSIQKFAVLSNHYVTSDALAAALGVPKRTVTAIYNALQQGKQSRVLQRAEILNGVRVARHKMTDRVRREGSRQQVAPVARVGPVTITPYRPFVDLGRYGIQESFWVGYHVEFLPEPTIQSLIEQYVDLFIDTGQFNSMRFEYIAETSVYLENSAPADIPRAVGKFSKFMDKELRKQQREGNIVKLSSQSFSFNIAFELGDGGQVFGEYIMARWQEIKERKGGIRITDLYFTDDPYVKLSYEGLNDEKQRKRGLSNAKKRASVKRKGKRKGGAK